MHDHTTLVTMEARACAERFNELFDRTYHRFHQVAHPRAFRASPESIAALHHLAGTGPLTVTEACAHFDRSQAAVSERFARLEARGLVTRFPDERDRRRTLVWLSDLGREALAAAKDVLSVDRLHGALATLSPEVRRALVDALAALVDAPRTPPTPDRDGPNPPNPPNPHGESGDSR